MDYSQQDFDPEEEYLIGEDLLLKKDWLNAKKHFESVIQYTPNHTEALNGLAKCLSEIQPGTTQEIQYLKQALQGEPGDQFTIFNIGNYYFKRGAFRQAIKYYSDLLKLDPNHPRAPFNLALSHDYLGEFDQSVRIYKSLEQKEPNNVKILNNYGISLFRNQQPNQAIAMFERALKLEDSAITHNNMGICLKNVGRVQEAVTHFRHAIQKFKDARLQYCDVQLDVRGSDSQKLIEIVEDAIPDNPFTKIDIAASLEQANDIDSALQLYIQIHQETPDIVNLPEKIQQLRGRGARDEEEARMEHDSYNNMSEAQLEEILQTDPNDLEALYRLALIKFAAQDYNRAKHLLEHAKSRTAKFRVVELNTLLGDAYFICEEYHKAPQAFMTALNFDKENASTWLKLGRCAEKNGDLARAIEFYRKATVYDHNLAEAHQHLGWAMVRTDNEEEGTIELEKSYQLDPHNFDTLIKLGNTLVKHKPKAERALGLFTEAAQLKPDNSDAVVGMARAHEKLGRQDEARAKYEETERLREISPNAYFFIGCYYEGKQNREKSIDMFRNCLNIEPLHLPANLHLGTILTQVKDIDGAIHQFTKATEIDHKNISANFALGKLRQTKPDQQEQAEFHYLIVLKQDMQHFKSLTQLGIIQIGRKNYQRGIEYFKESHRINPTFLINLLAIANAYFDIKCYNGALRYYTLAQKFHPNDPRPPIGIGNSLYEMGFYESSAVYFRAALRINPNISDVHFNLGNSLTKLQDTRGSIQEYQECIRLNPRKHAAYLNLGLAYVEVQEFDAAIQAFTNLAQLTPTSAIGFYNIGNALYLSNRHDEAIPYLQRALQLDSTFADCHYNIACVYFDKQNFDLAYTHYLESVKYDNRNHLSYLRLGVLSERRREFDQAHGYYNAALEINPTDPETREKKESLNNRWKERK